MSREPIRVLVVDDSALIREIIGDAISATPGMTVAGMARDGAEAIEQTAALRPDVVTLDVQMPNTDGLAALEAIMKTCPTPVIMVSDLTRRAAAVTMESLERGAVDYIAKPGDLGGGRQEFLDALRHKVRVMAGVDVQRVLRIRRSRSRRGPAKKSCGEESRLEAAAKAYTDCCVAIGISTGGPPALSQVFQELQPPLPPIVIVQHMPAQFTGPFAARLDSISALSVKEAGTDDVLRPNQALIAPGGTHLRLRQRGGQVVARIETGEPVSGHRPSVDVMMGDAAAIFGKRCLGVIMTGMGHDGVAGCAAIREAQGYVLGQDEATSDVYGMNKAAFVAGHVDRQFPLTDLPQVLTAQAKKMFRLGGTPTLAAR